jgi:hypothetical protein
MICFRLGSVAASSPASRQFPVFVTIVPIAYTTWSLWLVISGIVVLIA